MRGDDRYVAPAADLGSEPHRFAFGTGRGGAAPVYSWGRGLDWIRFGFGLFQRSPGTWMALGLLAFLIGNAEELFSTDLFTMSSVTVIGGVVTSVLSVIIEAGLLLGCAAQQRGERLAFGTLIAGFRHPSLLSLIGLGLLNMAVTVGLLLLLGVALASIVGAAVFASMSAAAILNAILGAFLAVLASVLAVLALGLLYVMAVWLAPPLIVFGGLPPVAALKESFAANLHNLRPLTVYGLLMALLFTLAVLPLFLGLLVYWPLAATTRFVAYCDMFGTPEPSQPLPT